MKLQLIASPSGRPSFRLEAENPDEEIQLRVLSNVEHCKSSQPAKAYGILVRLPTRSVSFCTVLNDLEAQVAALCSGPKRRAAYFASLGWKIVRKVDRFYDEAACKFKKTVYYSAHHKNGEKRFGCETREDAEVKLAISLQCSEAAEWDGRVVDDQQLKDAEVLSQYGDAGERACVSRLGTAIARAEKSGDPIRHADFIKTKSKKRQ